MRLIDAEKLMKDIVNTPSSISMFYCDDAKALTAIACRQHEILELVKEQHEFEECDIHCRVHDSLKKQIAHLQEKNAQYIETIQELKTEALSGWIPCTLCSNDFYQGKWADEECMIAWQPLPEPYKESE